VLHYDGSEWKLMHSGVTENLFGVWGLAPDNVFAVGFGGVVLHYTGEEPVPTATPSVTPKLQPTPTASPTPSATASPTPTPAPASADVPAWVWALAAVFVLLLCGCGFLIYRRLHG